MSATESLQAKIHREISELTSSLSGLVENFKRMKRPLIESQETVPQATNQLDKISEQTEAAAHHMLDRVETITQREEDVISGLTGIRSRFLQGDTDGIVPLIEDLTAKANANLNDAFMIMDSLQFQDITAQQMDHAASLLEDLEGKLQQVLVTFGGEMGEEVQATPASPKKVRAYDPHADLFEKKTAQEDIDSLFKAKK